MLFGKKKTTPSQPQAQTQFKKEKLSADALDHFAMQYPAEPGELGSFKYILQNGQEVLISERGMYNKENPVERNHFEYLLGQTLPYHKRELTYHLRDLMYITDENGNPVLWSKDKKAIIQFTKLVEFSSNLLENDLIESDPRNPVFTIYPKIPAVTHIDKEHPAPGEE